MQRAVFIPRSEGQGEEVVNKLGESHWVEMDD